MYQFRVWLGGALIFCITAGYSQSTHVNDSTPTELALALGAKLLCSQVFIAERDEHEALYNSVWPFVNSGYVNTKANILDYTEVDIDIDRTNSRVSFRHERLGLQREAGYYADQGCIIHPKSHNRIFFEPVQVETSLPPADTLPWPMGDVVSDTALPPEVNQEELEKVVPAAFLPGNYTAAFIVVYKGQIIAERYGPGIDKDTLLEGWSTGKSVAATLLGVAINDEPGFDLFTPAPFEEWQGEGDPRQQIRIADLLRMSSGLKYSYWSDDPATWEQPVSDHMFVYMGGINVFDFSVNRPAEFPPNTVGRYRNSDPLLIGYLVKKIVEAKGEDYLTFPQRALFDKIGIRKFILETDPYGNFVHSGYEYNSARNWARIGMLYLQDGIWNGERLLPEGFVEFIRTPAPAWEEPVYGGLFWLNLPTRWEGLPPDSFGMSGGGGQRIIMVPSRDIVIVRLGHMIGYNFRREGFKADLSVAFQHLMRAIPEN